MEKELKTNAVKLSPEEQYQIRNSIVRLSKKGKTNDEIAEILDVSERHKEEIEVFYLPTYAPEYNSDELVNSDLKRSVGSKTSPQSKEVLEHNVRSHLKSLQLDPSKISSFFNAPYTNYAA